MVFVSRGGSGHIDDFGQRVVNGVSRLRGLDIGDELEVEILGQLVRSRRTVAEMVEGIYGLGSADEGFNSCYTRVRRGVKRLESKGFISTNIFGWNKPYRLTDLAMVNLARIGGDVKQLDVVSRYDLAAFLATAALMVPVSVLGAEWFQLSDLGVVVLFAAFFFLLGACFVRFLQTFRRVF